jgi:hypothetical protein
MPVLGEVIVRPDVGHRRVLQLGAIRGQRPHYLVREHSEDRHVTARHQLAGSNSSPVFRFTTKRVWGGGFRGQQSPAGGGSAPLVKTGWFTTQKKPPPRGGFPLRGGGGGSPVLKTAWFTPHLHILPYASQVPGAKK